MSNEVKIVRNFNTYSMSDFKIKLSEETWDNIRVFDESDVNKMFDNFHNTYLRILYSRFSKKNNSNEGKREYLDDQRYNGFNQS
jgi:hypothetical protein